MLLKFSVQNHRSIADRQELLFTASSLDDSPLSLIPLREGKLNVLPCIAIYGANASGKSNILKALQFARNAIMQSQSLQAETSIPLQPFRLLKEYLDEPSTYEFDFIVAEFKTEDGIINDMRFVYGFSVDSYGVLEEWLYAYPLNHRQVWFHRNRNEDKEFYFGPELKGQNKVISSLTRSNVLFLSSASTHNHKQLSQIHSFFRRILTRLNTQKSIEEKAAVISNFLEHPELKVKLLEFVKAADVGIVDASSESIEGPEDIKLFLDDLVELSSKYKFDTNEALRKIKDQKRIKFNHSQLANNDFFDIFDESDGTVTYLDLIGSVILALGSPRNTLVVDEIDSSLHPLLCRKIVDLFLNPETNPLGSQLIFTTHDTNLLSDGSLRRDQIWLVEKNETGKSHIYPLSDLKLRKTDNLQKGYIQGRFGAIPYLNFSNIHGN